MASRAPPCFPRQIFVDAFAAAGARAISPRPERSLPRQRDLLRASEARATWRSIGFAVVAAFAEPVTVATPQVRRDPILDALMAEPQIARLIGQLASAPDRDASAWVEIDREGPAPKAKLFYRGVAIPGDRVSRAFDDATGRVVKVQQRETQRTMRLEDLQEAARVMRERLRDAGEPLGAFFEVRRVKTPDFQGGVATISLGRGRSEPARALSAAR